MNINQLEEGKRLVKVIEATSKGLDEVNNLINKKRDRKDNKYDDGVYSLYICENRDGSGIKADLCRYGGNLEVLVAIKSVLEKQLKSLKDDFETL